MRKIIFKEWFFLSLGLIVILLGLFFFKTPPTLKRINWIESYIFHGLVLIIGLFFIVFVLSSIFRKESLFFQPKIKGIIINLKILFFSILLCLILLEVFLQLTALEGCSQDDTALHHSYKPNCSVNSKSEEWDISVKINSEGFRDDEIKPKNNYDYRILMLGDSFTVGWGMDQGTTFSDILEQKFNQDKLKVDIINAGSTSYSPILEYLFLKEKGLKYNPDVIIINFDLSDFQNDYYYQKLARYDVAGELLGVSPERANFLKSAYLKIKLIKFIENPFIILDSKFPPKNIWGKEYFYNLDYDRYALTRLNVSEEVIEQFTKTTFKYLKWIHNLALEKNITLILVTYPYGHQISATEWAEGRHNYGFEQGKIYSNLPEKILAAFAMKNNIYFISLYSEFKNSDEFPLFYPYDGHFTSKGHQLYADYLYTKFLEKGIFINISATNKIQPTSLRGQATIPFIKDICVNLNKNK